jgi:hypothetical protein
MLMRSALLVAALILAGAVTTSATARNATQDQREVKNRVWAPTSCASVGGLAARLASKTGYVSDALGTHFVRRGVGLVYRPSLTSITSPSFGATAGVVRPPGNVNAIGEVGGNGKCIASDPVYFETTLRSDYSALACRTCASTKTNLISMYGKPNLTRIVVLRITQVGEFICENSNVSDRGTSVWYYTDKDCWVWAGGTARADDPNAPMWSYGSPWAC